MTAAPRRSPGTDWPSLRRLAPPVVLLGLLLAGWQTLVLATSLPTVVLPGPADVAAAGVAAAPALAVDAAVTGLTAGIGLAGGLLLGVAFAFAATNSRAAAAIVTPYVLAFRIAPVVAVGPLVFLWIGSGILARAVLVASITVFPVTIAAIDGLRSVPREYLDTARSVAAPRGRTFLRVTVPAAAPGVLAGLKVAATLAVIGAVVAEFVTLNDGIGTRVFTTSSRLRTAEMYAALLVVAALGLAFYLLPVALESRLGWRTE